MAQLHTVHTYSTDVESVFALIRDPAFRTESCAAQGSVEHDVQVDDDGTSATVTITRLQEAPVPAYVKKFVGELAKVTQTERWSAPDASGDRTATIKVVIHGQPAGMTGSARLRSLPDGDTEFTVEGEVKVAVPFLGRRFEPPIVDAIVDSVVQDVELGTARL